ncbi:hypothetical protein [Amycolatopsis sp. DSM 110486]|uniref:hypothetical protein n=1 Tax=Amycolatopsis sp. DSM 110486 TaxID=2865832 RepID=UPI001C69484E|nr:hypothetical protein [Amycolatopsis sp. DSM 110486]QYN19020.1 hypothetical protein K1T34_41095 [Amycolatopsis sp. DSM 110486]
MPDLLWDEVRSLFDPHLMGALPNVSVADASAEDWQAVFDLVRSRGWAWEYRLDDVVTPLPKAVEALGHPVDAELRVWPATGVLAIFRTYSPDQIDFDVDLRELQGQTGVNVLCDLLRAIGQTLGKPVLLTPEGDSGQAVLGFDPRVDRVVLMADPDPRTR